MEIDLDKLIPGTKNFRWNEMLRCSSWGVYVFPDDQQYLNIMSFMSKVQLVRNYLDARMIVTSGLRPYLYNKWKRPYGINGAVFSAHKLGLAMDFYCPKIGCDRIREILHPVLDDFDIRMENNPGSGWVHIDGREAHNGHRFFDI